MGWMRQGQEKGLRGSKRKEKSEVESRKGGCFFDSGLNKTLERMSKGARKPSVILDST